MQCSRRILASPWSLGLKTGLVKITWDARFLFLAGEIKRMKQCIAAWYVFEISFFLKRNLSPKKCHEIWVGNIVNSW